MSKKRRRTYGGAPRTPRQPRVNQQDVMQQIEQMQAQMQEALEDEKVTVTAGGGMIAVTMTGQQQLENIIISPEVVDSDDIEMLQDLIIAAINEAIEKSRALAEEKSGTLVNDLLGNMGMGGMNIPGLM